jgi:hypothetical protein
VVANYNNGVARSKSFTGLAAGSWGLHGASITAYGIPNGATVDSFLWVPNTGAAVTVNAPVANITVNAGYKVTAADGATDRLTLETSDSLD